MAGALSLAAKAEGFELERAARRLSSGFDESVRSLVLVLTSRCNLSCPYCSQSRGSNARMSWGILRRSLDVVLDGGCRRPRIEFYGGEPLLAFDLVREAVAYVDGRRRESVEPEFSLSTNGVLLTPEVLDFLDRHRITTQLSLDGIAAAQDDRSHGSFTVLDVLLRSLPGEHGTFFRDLLSVKVTLTGRNLPFLAASLRYLLAREVPRISVSPLTTPDPDWPPDALGELERQVRGVFRSSIRHYRSTGSIPVDFVCTPAGPNGLVADDRPLCGFGRSTLLVVDSDGSVLPCAGVVGFPASSRGAAVERYLSSLRLCSVFDPDLSEKLHTRAAKAHSAEILTRCSARHSGLGRCGECTARADCHPCPLATALLPGNADPHRVSDQACTFALACSAARRRFSNALMAMECSVGTGGGRAFQERGRHIGERRSQ